METLEAVAIERSRLSESQLAALTKKLGSFAVPIVNGGTTEHEAGFKLGIQYVLHQLREGWGNQ